MSASERSHAFSARALTAVVFFFWFSQYAFSAYINPMLIRWGASAAFMGLVNGMYGGAQLALRIPVGLLADRYNRQKAFILAGCVLAFTAALGLYVSTTPAQMLLFRTLSGVSACAWVCCTVLYSRCFAAGESSGRINGLNTVNYLGRLCSYLVVALVIARTDIRTTFLIGAIGGALAVLCCLGVSEIPARGNGGGFRAYLAVMRERNLLTCSLLAAAVQFVTFATEYSFSVNVQTALGASAETINALNIALLIPSIAAGAWVSRRLMRGARPHRFVCAGLMLFALYCFLATRVPRIGLFFPLQLLAGVANACTIPVLMGQSVQRIPLEKRSTAMGFYQAMYSLGMTFGPMAMGVLIDRFGYVPSFDAMACLGLLTCVLTWSLLRRPRGTQLPA